MTDFPKYTARQLIRVTSLLIICTLAIYGCSGSSDSGSSEIQTGGESVESSVEVDNGTSNNGAGMTDIESVSDLPVGDTDSESNESTIDDSQSSSPVASDPFSPDSNDDIDPVAAEMLLPVSASVELLPAKTFRIRWEPTGAADFYRVLENPDGVSGFTAISGELEASTEFYDHQVPLHKRVNARYMVEACNSEACTLSAQQLIEGNLAESIGYLKASNPDRSDRFGASVSLSADGNTLAVGAVGESSAATGIDGDQSDDSAETAGAVYIFTRNDNVWQQQAYLKASNADPGDAFGLELSLSADGNSLAVGSSVEASNARGVNGDQSDNSVFTAGAVYVFVRNSGNWQQQAYLKASNTNSEDVTRNRSYGLFGQNISLSADGNTLAVGARTEESAALGINGDQNNNDAPGSGAVYVFTRSNAIWRQQAYIKATQMGSRNFGRSVSLSADGNALAVGRDGAVHMFLRTSGNWQEQALVGEVGLSPIVSLSGDGNTIAVAAGTTATIFENIDGDWQVLATFSQFGRTGTSLFDTDGISLSADGSTLALGNSMEGTGQIGLQGFQGVQPQVARSGAVFVYARGDGTWQQEVYVKASNTSSLNMFGTSVSLSENGDTLVVGAELENGASAGFNGDQTQVDGPEFEGRGAVYLY